MRWCAARVGDQPADKDHSVDRRPREGLLVEAVSVVEVFVVVRGLLAIGCSSCWLIDAWVAARKTPNGTAPSEASMSWGLQWAGGGVLQPEAPDNPTGSGISATGATISARDDLVQPASDIWWPGVGRAVSGAVGDT
jgi:hypothetical protein